MGWAVSCLESAGSSMKLVESGALRQLEARAAADGVHSPRYDRPVVSMTPSTWGVANRAARCMEAEQAPAADARAVASGLAAVRGLARAGMPKQAAVIVLRDLMGLKWPDVAATVGCSVRMAHRYRSTALEWLDAAGPLRAAAGIGFAG